MRTATPRLRGQLRYSALLVAAIALMLLTSSTALAVPTYAEQTEALGPEPDPAYQLIYNFEVRDESRLAPLRAGTADWGKQHIEQDHGWDNSTEECIAAVLRGYTGEFDNGPTSTGYTMGYTDVWSRNQVATVIVEWDSGDPNFGSQGIISAYTSQDPEDWWRCSIIEI